MSIPLRRRVRLSLIVFAMVVVLLPTSAATAATSVFINEIHYDNDGADAGEAIEVAGPAGTDLAGWSIVLYNGSTGASYATINLSGVIANQGGGYGTLAFAQAGIQNGSPDGLALVDAGNSVVQFLSYEGSFAAVGGPADGTTSTDIGVAEASSTPVGDSLQLAGTGTMYEDFTWQAAGPATFGDQNTGQTFGDGAPPPPPAGSDTLVINEIDYDQPSTDTAEFVEILNVSDAAIDLDGYSLVFVNGNGDSVYKTVALPAGELAAGDFFVVCGDAANVENCDLDESPDSNLIQNGSPDAVALVNGEGIVDTVSYEGNTGAGYTETTGATGDSGSTGFVSISRDTDGSDTDNNAADFALVCTTPGEVNAEDADDCAPPVEVKIHEIQGTGGASPLIGQRVIIEGVVVGDEETFDSLAGFFVQEEDTDVDADPATSEGVFVFNHAGDDVNIGDVVRVEGTVDERFDNTQLTDFVVIEVLDVEPRVATPATVEFPLTAIEDLEAYEGMAIYLPQTVAILEYFNYDRFGEIVVGLPTPGQRHQFNPTAVFEPGSADGIDMADRNRLSRITIDDGQSSQNPDFNVHPIFRDEFTLDNAFRGGDLVTGLTGTVYFSFGQHKLYPTSHEDYDANPRPGERAPYVGGRIQVATLNALNYFLTVDSGPDICGPNLDQGCRGADDENERERQRAKLLEALLGLKAEVIGLVEVENTTGVEPLADLVDGMNAAIGWRVYDYVETGTVGPDVIKVGVIYNRWRVKPTGDVAVLDSPDFLDPNNLGDDKNRAALAVSFKERWTGQKFSVAVNHLKSKGSPCGDGDDSPFAGSCNLTRTLAAERLAEWITTNPTGVDDPDWLIIGDLNSYDKEDPIDALRDAGYTDLIAKYSGEFAYSFVFDGQVGYLDYIMSSKSMKRQITKAAEWNINADEPDIFDYDTSFKSDTQDALFDGSTPYRSSDHDAAIVGLRLKGRTWWWPPRWR